MSFDAKQAVQEKVTHLEDELQNLEAQRASAVNDFDTKINAVKEQLDGWNALVGSKPEPEKPAAKKAAAKK